MFEVTWLNSKLDIFIIQFRIISFSDPFSLWCVGSRERRISIAIQKLRQQHFEIGWNGFFVTYSWFLTHRWIEMILRIWITQVLYKPETFDQTYPANILLWKFHKSMQLDINKSKLNVAPGQLIRNLTIVKL